MSHQQPVLDFIVQPSQFHQQIDWLYQPLDTNCEQIRLMNITPDHFEEENVNVTLDIINLEDALEYEAISYTWDDLHPVVQITICGVPYNVTTNQYAALRRFRLADRPRTMWMDVICINQADLTERSHQVSIMGQIYASAIRTVVWLGEPEASWSEVTDHDWNAHVVTLNSNADQVRGMRHFARNRPVEIVPRFLEIVAGKPDGILRAVPHILQLVLDRVALRHMPYCYIDENEELVHCRPFYEVMELILSLLRRRWWHRVWVLQEACLSKTAPLIDVAGQQIPVRVFIDVRRAMMDQWDVWQPEDNVLCAVYDFNALLDVDRRLSSYANAVETIGPKFGRLNLRMALELVDGRNATDMRDFVYGILGVVRRDGRVPIDYELTTGAVFALASWHCFSEYVRGWNMLKRASGLAATEMPSWAIDWTVSNVSYFADFEMFVTDDEPDSDLVMCYHTEGVLQSVANEVVGIKAVLKTPHDSELASEDQIPDLVDNWARQLVVIGLFPESGFHVDCEVTATFFSTLYRESRPDDYGTGIRYTSDDDWKDGFHVFQELKLQLEGNQEHITDRNTRKRFAKNLLLSLQDSALCVTEQGELCMAPNTIEAGDYLYHVNGCCVPLALRPAKSTILSWIEEDDGPLLEREIHPFKVVGPCYLRGAMGIDGADPAKTKVIYLV